MKNNTLFTLLNTSLLILYYISYVLVLFAFLEWEGRMIAFITIVLFGIPLIAFFLPFVGGVMFSTKNGLSSAFPIYQLVQQFIFSKLLWQTVFL